MTMSSLHARRLVATGFLFAAVGMLACEGDPPTSPDGLQIRAAKPPKDGDGDDPTVTSADPSSGEQGAVGLVIMVEGLGFEKGAKVAFHLKLDNGDTDPDPDPGMIVQSTRFETSTLLIATVDIALDAEVAARYISVSFRGRRGIGTEALFEVKEKQLPPVLSESVDFHISLADSSSGDALTNDGREQNAACPGKLYCEGVDFVGAHLSGVGHLMFWTSQDTNGGQASVRRVRIDVNGDRFGFQGSTDDRIFTNSNDPAVDLRDLGVDGNSSSVTSRMIVETEVGYFLKFGVDCFDNEARPTRVTVSRIGDVWTITPNGGAYLCRKTGKGKKAVTEEAFVSAVTFTMEMTKVGTS
jgi:hypothetical protein